MNAEIISEYYVTEKTAEDYHKVLDTNVIGPAICAREAIQSMKKRGVDGHIVNINSIADHYAETITIPMEYQPWSSVDRYAERHLQERDETVSQYCT
ncbi:dehydrogenase/reductase SDR family member 11-like [Augochlora pura]